MKVRYYHGGVRGLKVGDRVLPVSQSGSLRAAVHFAHDRPEYQARVREHVYITPSRDLARFYAGAYPGGGALYEVRPDEPVEHDPDYLPDDGQSLQCPAATVLAVMAPCVVANPAVLASLAKEADQ